MTDSQAVEAFEIHVKQEAIDDLKARLLRTRWPDEAEGANWIQGTSLSFMKELTNYWVNKFDWRSQERRLNSFPQFKAKALGWKVHFVLVRGKGPKPMPILLLHGWPDSFAGMLKLVPYLTDPASNGGERDDSFDVVIPSLPGYGFSDKQSKKGWINRAEILHSLMTDVLGYRRFAVQGGDVGAGVTTDLAYLYPNDLIGIQINSDLRLPSPMPDRSDLSESEREYLRLLDEWEREEWAYGRIQETKPQTISYGLNDSPVGLAAYIIEKFRAWGGHERRCGEKVHKGRTPDNCHDILGD